MTDITRLSLDDLWRDIPPTSGVFDRTTIAHLPEAAQRYLGHAIAPGTSLASAVRLEMRGEIKLKARWIPFEADQVLRWDRGFIWRAKTRMGALTIKGTDRFIDGQGAMRWKLLGLFPVMSAGGPDISRSAAGRFQAESMWLPSALLSARWSQQDATHLQVVVPTRGGNEGQLTLNIDRRGRLLETSMTRWGNPDGGPFREVPFGAVCEDEATFGGYTIPTKLRVGWHFGTERFEPDGEFWRANITSVTYR